MRFLVESLAESMTEDGSQPRAAQIPPIRAAKRQGCWSLIDGGGPQPAMAAEFGQVRRWPDSCCRCCRVAMMPAAVLAEPSGAAELAT